MIDVIITSYREPNSTLRAVRAFLSQLIKQDKEFRIIVCDPFLEVKQFLKENIKDKRIGFFLDPGEGKAYALNLLFEKLHSGTKEDILILSDGDVYVSENAVEEILRLFEDPEIGCVTGHPTSLDSRENKYGYWSHLLFSGIHKVRKRLSQKGEFFECSGYLFAIRKSVITEFPIDASEDSIIPYLFWKNGYKIKYAENALVYVKNPDNWEDWKNQKIRNIKGHENLSKLVPDMPRTKSFGNEIKHGFFHTLFFPENFQEFSWSLSLFSSRLKIYRQAFKELEKAETYTDGWRETETPSTKTLD